MRLYGKQIRGFLTCTVYPQGLQNHLVQAGEGKGAGTRVLISGGRPSGGGGSSTSGHTASWSSTGAPVAETLTGRLRGLADGTGAAGCLMVDVDFCSRRNTLVALPQRHLRERRGQVLGRERQVLGGEERTGVSEGIVGR